MFLALAGDDIHDEDSVRWNTFIVDVPDFAHRSRNDLSVIEFRASRDFAANHH